MEAATEEAVPCPRLNLLLPVFFLDTPKQSPRVIPSLVSAMLQ